MSSTACLLLCMKLLVFTAAVSSAYLGLGSLPRKRRMACPKGASKGWKRRKAMQACKLVAKFEDMIC